jgi:hypothetical protein
VGGQVPVLDTNPGTWVSSVMGCQIPYLRGAWISEMHVSSPGGPKRLSKPKKNEFVLLTLFHSVELYNYISYLRYVY